MYSWILTPAESQGNLNITSAPATAVLGETEEIALDWSDATAGQWHLGSITHNGPTDELGTTIINVDNR
jgi:hypothetical protein